METQDHLPTTSSNFYHTSGTLHYGTPSYVERDADRELFEALVRGEFCYVLTSRQMGKSSLMIHTVPRLREQGIAVAVLDLTALGDNLTAEQWYEGLLSTIGLRLDLEDELEEFWLANERVGPLQRFMRAVREVVLPGLGVGMLGGHRPEGGPGVEDGTASPPKDPTTSPPHHLTTSPPHHLTTSPPHHLPAWSSSSTRSTPCGACRSRRMSSLPRSGSATTGGRRTRSTGG